VDEEREREGKEKGRQAYRNGQETKKQRDLDKMEMYRQMNK